MTDRERTELVELTGLDRDGTEAVAARLLERSEGDPARSPPVTLDGRGHLVPTGHLRASLTRRAEEPGRAA